MADHVSVIPDPKLNIRFVDLLSSLSALRSLTMVDFQVVDERLLIRNALKALIQNQDMETCSVFLLQDEYLVGVASLGWDDLCEPNDTQELRNHSGKRFGIGEGIIGKAALTRSIQYCSNCMNDPQFARKDDGTTEVVPGSLVSAPIEVGNELIGVLNISHPEINYFSAWHERLLTIYCSMLGHLIFNRRLFYDLEQQVNKRTAQLQQALRHTEELKKRYETLSMVDELTGLFNRRYFFLQAESALSSAIRYNQPICILLLDLDHFKEINDQYGHSVGDEVLLEVAKSLRFEVREGDIVARFGGEEFVAVLPNATYKTGFEFAARIRKNIKKLTWEHLQSKFRLTISIGVDCLTPGSRESTKTTLNQLIKNADTALYSAKSGGRDRVVMFSNIES